MAETRCSWPTNENLIDYHDKEWGVPVHDDLILFEMLVLEGAQAGLSWDTILGRRESYRAAFDNFDPKIVARYDDAKSAELLQDAGIIRNRLKVASAIRNAKAFLAIQENLGSFDAYAWRFVDGTPKVNAWTDPMNIPANTPQSDAMSKDLKAKGFNFVGTTICYAYMQSVGMVNDHAVDCFRYKQVANESR
ncbi:MAG: DNA-3-methyladenine glycosylase I [SAR202 cluster bacterium]|nr:DNA-3-methyladenine glycosylase I [SAR202 cluster bacterium]MDP7533969.1 DNA-3-methyladenine glycosylase I [SAR202 cluster bacterium]